MTEVSFASGRAEENESVPGKMLKRKSTMEEIDVLKKKKQQFETDVEAFLKSADEFADRAEDSRNLSWITKSNSL